MYIVLAGHVFLEKENHFVYINSSLRFGTNISLKRY